MPKIAKPRAPEAAETAEKPLSAEELELMHAYWRACNYLAVG